MGDAQAVRLLAELARRIASRETWRKLLFRAMFDRSPIAIALLTQDRCITMVNTACEQLLGRDAAGLVGTTATELSPPDPAARRRGPDDQVTPNDRYEIHFTRPDGRQVWGRSCSTGSPRPCPVGASRERLRADE